MMIQAKKQGAREPRMNAFNVHSGFSNDHLLCFPRERRILLGEIRLTGTLLGSMAPLAI